MSARSTILAGDLTVFYAAENGREQVKWTGSATGTRTLNELYSALQDLFDEPAQMDDLVPIRADTPDIYRMINQWFIDDDTVEHLTAGALFTAGWAVGTTEHVKIIGYSPTTEFSTHDIGRTILGTTTTDLGTLLDFNTQRNLAWIRPNDPTLGQDDFSDGDESYTIGVIANGDPLDEAWRVQAAGSPIVFVEETTDANSTADADWDLFSGIGSPASEGSPATDGGHADYHAFGFGQEFSSLTFDNVSGGATAGVAGVVAWEYWNGTLWTALTGVTDGTTSFTTAKADGQIVFWTAPTDWATTSINNGAQLFFIRARVTTVYSTLPVYDQGFISGVGAGAFAIHGRHGCGSKGGESAWAGITTIGTIQSDTHLYIFQEDLDQPAGDFEEENVVATKGTSDWWDQGQIDILLKTKEADSIFGELPNATRTSNVGVATVLARKFTSLYSNFTATALSTAGGNTVVPLASGADLNNTTGFRRLILESPPGETSIIGSFVVGDLISADAIGFGSPATGTAFPIGAITAVSSGDGSGSPITLDYYLINDPITDFVNTDSVSNQNRAGDAQAAANPTDVGPALGAGITTAFGENFLDINNGSGSRPFSILVDPATNTLQVVYERLKYLTRRGAANIFVGQEGQEYIGNELQIEFTSFNKGDIGTTEFVEGEKVFDQTTNAEGIIHAYHPDDQGSGVGSPVTAGDLIIKTIRGTFGATNIISDSPDPSQAVASALSFESPSTFLDETVQAGSPGGPFLLFPAANNVDDIFYVGAEQVFARVRFDIQVQGVGVAGLNITWEYWNGEGGLGSPLTGWADLEGGGSPPVVGFVDNTNQLTAAAGFRDIWFYPPRDWVPVTINDAAVPCVGPFFYIRARIHESSFSTAPQANQILIEDNVTATAGTLRTISPVPGAPFGTLAGGVFFGAPGVALVTSNLATGEEQSFQLIDDDGVTQVPPNTVSVAVTNLLCGDAVAVFRLLAGVIDKTEFTLAADGSPPGNTIGESFVKVDTTIGSDTVTNVNSKIRIISSNGSEHRYRYDSYTLRNFTLSPASTGTATSGSTTSLVDSGADFVTDEVEVGDYVRNVGTGDFARITQVGSPITTVVTDAVPVTWNGAVYSINTLVENYPTGTNAYVPFIERIAGGCGSPATSTSESNQLVQSVTIDVRVVVRNAGNILPFTQDAQIGSTGLSLATIRTSDDIFTA